ncbi:MAG: phosphoribosylformylglycinamidine synthase subunit PurQ [Bdellovibrionota bacterium]
MKPIGVLTFPGTNCDEDVFKWAGHLGNEPKWISGQDHFEPKDYEALLIPGGFSYGDYLRCGALAARSPAMEDVRRFAQAGGFVLGICNGFQILCESGLLPGALVRNEGGLFRDDFVQLRVTNYFKIFPHLSDDKIVRIPIAHGEGRYTVDPQELKKLQDEGQVWLSYADNPNGSLGDIAGISNENKNVFGLMPHPERAYQPWMDSEDGRFFQWKLSSKNIV